MSAELEARLGELAGCVAVTELWCAEAQKALYDARGALRVERERAERLQEAIENENPERWSFATLLDIADIILARHYPSDVFVDRGEDVGSSFVVALRESVAVCRAVLAEQEKEQER